ncbi:hypothetical protein ACFQJD_03680 [Haloplanus sp. GCM10025708]|uniref:DUF7312 domain-containing protein n=1 Tax=Haloferacaceae TaxID=1644056 RepID=UPI003621FA09
MSASDADDSGAGDDDGAVDADGVSVVDDGVSAADDDAEDEAFWRFDPDDVESSPPETLEPGHPDLENVFFILLGVALTVAFLWSAM